VTSHKDYYAVLDINPHADGRAIAEAYERLARRYQPDDSAPPTDPEGMREIDEAFDILDDPASRAEYDRLRSHVIATGDPPATIGVGWAPVREGSGLVDPVTAAAVPKQRPAWVAPALLALAALAFVTGAVALLLVALVGSADRTVTLASGLRYVEMAKGSGESPHLGNALTAHYTGTLEDGTEFDSSRNSNPFVFVLGAGEVIKGWDEGFATMRVGGKRKLIIPPDLAYGPQGTPDGTIPPNATIVFEVELLEIQPIGQEILTQSGLRYTDLDPGRNERRQAISPKEGEEVVVHYRGTLPDGATFVDTEAQGAPYTFVLSSGSEIRGFDEGISTMKVGGLRRLVVPPELAYGDEPKDFTVGDELVTIQPNTTVTFLIRLVGIQDPSAQGQ
jgi:peptidylprolyl isomerase